MDISFRRHSVDFSRFFSNVYPHIILLKSFNTTIYETKCAGKAIIPGYTDCHM